MNRSRLFALGCCAALSLVLSVPSAVAQAPGGGPSVRIENPLPLPVDPSQFTHLGRSLDTHVDLTFRLDVFQRLLPDGTVEETEFAIPPGHILVITDINWRGHTGTQVLDLMGSVRLGKKAATGPGFATMLESVGVSHFGGRITGAEHFTSGARFSFVPDVGRINVESLDTLIVRGYLMPQ